MYAVGDVHSQAGKSMGVDTVHQCSAFLPDADLRLLAQVPKRSKTRGLLACLPGYKGSLQLPCRDCSHSPNLIRQVAVWTGQSRPVS